MRRLAIVAAIIVVFGTLGCSLNQKTTRRSQVGVKFRPPAKLDDKSKEVSRSEHELDSDRLPLADEKPTEKEIWVTASDSDKDEALVRQATVPPANADRRPEP